MSDDANAAHMLMLLTHEDATFFWFPARFLWVSQQTTLADLI